MKKKKLKMGIISLLGIAVLLSCEKDNVEPGEGNLTGNYKIDGQTINLGTEAYWYTFDVLDTDHIGIHLSAADIDKNPDHRIELSFANTTEIPEGSFTYEDLTWTKDPKQKFESKVTVQFIGGGVGYDQTLKYDIKTGSSITVAKSGDDYEIAGDFTTEKGDVMLQFKGKLPNTNPFE